MQNSVKEISAQEAWLYLKEHKNAELIDVRTEGEWHRVGYPDLFSIGKQVHKISWVIAPDMRINVNFIDSLEKTVPMKDKVLLFICKSGYRSSNAASFALERGYKNCININNGFEGVNGWNSYFPIKKGL